jgi:hypothetical protein
MAETISRSLLAGALTQIKNVQLNGEVFPAFVDDVVTSGRFITIFSGATSSRNSRKKRAAQGQRGGLSLTYDLVMSNGDEQAQTFEFGTTSRYRAILHDGALKAMEAKLELQQMHKEYLNARYTHGLSYGDRFAEMNGGRVYRYEDTADSRDKKADMISYSVETNVLCPFTAFVGVQNICPGKAIL